MIKLFNNFNLTQEELVSRKLYRKHLIYTTLRKKNVINIFLKTRKAKEWKYIRVYDWLKA